MSRSDSAGVEIVISTGNDQPLTWTFHREYTLGGADEGPEMFHSVTATNVGTDRRGRIYVLDSQGHRIVVFSSNGDFLLEFGGEGQGPGEMAYPNSLAVSPEGAVSVFDFGKGGLVRYGPEGQALEERPFEFYPWPNRQRHIASMDDGMLVATMMQGDEENTVRHVLQSVSATDTTVIADWSFPAGEMARYESCGGGLNLPRVFEVEIAWSAVARSVVLSRSPGYELEEFQDGALVRRFGRQVQPRVATHALAVAELGEGFRINFGQGPCTISPREMVEKRGYAPFVPWIQQVTRPPGGDVWVLRKEVGPDSSGPIDVFDVSGAYVGTLGAGAPYPIVFLDEGRFGAAETDEFDVTRLVVYRVVKN